jgi:putrescine transport system substrate-binding protein
MAGVFHMLWKTLKILPVALIATGTVAHAADKVVYVYNWSNYIADDTVKNFTKKTGIKVVYDVYDTMETLEAKVYAGSSGYDVIVPTNPNLKRMIDANVLLPLDKSKIPNDKHQWPLIAERLASYDPGNKFAEDYMWGTTGIGYNVDKVKAALGNVPVNSWAILFDPKNAAKLKDCGVELLDSPDDVIPSALEYLGLNPDSKSEDDLNKAAAAITAIVPYVTKFNSSQIDDMANGDACVTLGYSGDMYQARDAATQAKKGVTVAYAIPKEGALMWFDSMAVLKDAPHPAEALAFINYMLDPKVAADNTNFVEYPNGNLDSQKFIDKGITGDPNVYPPTDFIKSKLFVTTPNDQATQRIVTRLWTTIKTGQ